MRTLCHSTVSSFSTPRCFSVRVAGEGGDGDGDPAVREGQSSAGRTAGPAHPDLPGTGGTSPSQLVRRYVPAVSERSRFQTPTLCREQTPASLLVPVQ